MQVTLIRHGKTRSNLEHRYQGILDDPLCEQGIEELREKSSRNIYPKPDMLICSPKTRCIQTAKIVCGEILPTIEDDLRETDFGIFEGKTYEELKDTPDYIEWLDSNGEGEIPDGESRSQMTDRCISAFYRCMEQAEKSKKENIVFVVHGGTIMAIMERFASPPRPFYDFHIGNGDGFTLKIDRWSAESRYPAFKLSGEEH